MAATTAMHHAATTQWHESGLTDFERLVMDTFRRTSSALPTLPPSPQSQPPSPPAAPFEPRVDVVEALASGTLSATIELPGLSPTDVGITLLPAQLVIQGDVPRTPSAGWGVSPLLRERRTGAFRRVLPLPSGLTAEDVHAKMENGLLVVTFPKVAPMRVGKSSGDAKVVVH